jgi:acyl-homoserine lactone acylase PvdQ
MASRRITDGWASARAALLTATLALALVAVGASPAGAGAQDPAATALNIIPSGQYGSVPPPEGADAQALMYDALTPLFDQVTNADLNRYFKSEGLGVGPDGPAQPEEVARDDVTIVRDRFNVPHVKAETYEGGVWAHGWLAAKDRGLLLEQARYNGRVAAIDAPGLSAIALVAGLRSFVPSEQTEAEVAKQTGVLRRAGEEGRAVLRDIDTFISGINDYLAAHSPGTEPWTRNDMYAVNAIKGQFLGQGGGDEARRTQFLAGLQERLGRKRGLNVFNDLRQFKNPDAPTSIDGRFHYGRIPKRRRGNVIIDPGSFERTPAAPRRVIPRRAEVPSESSNTLMISARRSQTGNPLMVGGPQIGYFYPGLTGEIDMDAPGLRWRGATSVPFPGYLLIGRGRDFAVTLTSAGGDIVDQFALRLCGGSDEMYRYRGKCRAMERFDAGTLDGEPVRFLRTVHGPVVGYATVNGRKVAIASKRSSYGRDTLDQIFFRRLSTGQVRNPRTFFDAAAQTPQTFNSFYIDADKVAMFTSGRFPIRHRRVDPGLLTNGNGRFDWRGFLPKRRHPQGTDRRSGVMTNWNNNAARGFGAADSSWARGGSVGRVDLLDHNLERLQRNGKWSLASVTAAMNAAATQDVRAIITVPLLRRLLRPRPASPPGVAEQAQTMLDLLVEWRANGGSRLDRDLDGLIDDPGAAIMDAAWPRIANRLMRPRLGPQLDELHSLFSRFDQPPDGQFSGWHQYFDRDIRKLLGMRVARPFKIDYCGAGKRGACRRKIWGALVAAGRDLTDEQGTADPAEWRADATAERISFVPGVLPTTIRYTNRPTGIQQVISFRGGR